MKQNISNILRPAAFALAVVLTAAACKDNDDVDGLYAGLPFTCDENVTYSVSTQVLNPDSTVSIVESEAVRQRPTLACCVTKGDHSVATQYGFCYNTTGQPTVFDNVITIDESWPDAVLGLQKGILKDTTFTAVMPDGQVFVRAFLVPYPEGDVVYSAQSVMNGYVIK